MFLVISKDRPSPQCLCICCTKLQCIPRYILHQPGKCQPIGRNPLLASHTLEDQQISARPNYIFHQSDGLPAAPDVCLGLCPWEQHVGFGTPLLRSRSG